MSLDDTTLRPRVLALLRKYGRDTTSFQTLGDDYRYFFADDESCVAYVDTGAAWVAAGDPIAPPERIVSVARAFVHQARAHRRRPLFFAVEDAFDRGATECEALLIGEQPIWDPREWDATVHRVSSLREQIRRARAKNVRVEHLPTGALAEGAAARIAIERLIERWLRTRQMAPMRFLVALAPFTFREERRHYAAFRGHTLVGILAMSPIYARRGWFFENLLRDPSAPNGTTELLFDAAMRDLASEGIDHATLGLAPLAGVTAPWLRRARKWGRPLYDFDGLHAFKRKLRPARWASVSLVHPRGSAVVALYDTLVAFAGGSLVRFAVSSLFRGPEIVLRALTIVLGPWTLALALVPSRPWFPSDHVQNAWIVFDIGLGLGLVALAGKWRRPLATLLAIVITLDAIVTATEAVVWNASHMRSVIDLLPIAIAIAAPSLAAAVLWGARARRSWRDEGATVD